MATPYSAGRDPRSTLDLDVDKIVPNSMPVVSDHFGTGSYPVRVLLTRPMTFYEKKQLCSFRPDWVVGKDSDEVFFPGGDLTVLVDPTYVSTLVEDVRHLQALGRRLQADEEGEREQQRILVDRANELIAERKKRP